MKRTLFLLGIAIVLGSTVVQAQNPNAIYLYSWEPTSNTGKEFVPNPETDIPLIYDAISGNWTCQVEEWNKWQGSSYNGKILYSLDDDIVTYYAGSDQTSISQINFNNSNVVEFPVTIGSFNVTKVSAVSPAKLTYNGYAIAMANELSMVNVEIALNLDNETVTFNKLETSYEIPVLESILPESGSIIEPDTDGNVQVKLIFSGVVTDMTAIVEGVKMSCVPNSDGTVWTITVPPASIRESTTDNANGELVIKIQDVYSGNFPITLNSGIYNFINLSYYVNGYTNTALFNFAGESAGLETLDVYVSPFFNLGKELTIDNDSLEIYFGESTSYLFTVSDDYEIQISTDASTENYSLGTGWCIKTEYDPDGNGGEGSYNEENYRQGITLSIYSGAKDATFLITVTSKDSGVDSISSDITKLQIYNLKGQKINPLNLDKGIYIVNGKKVVVK